MLIILFGKPGVGKNFVANILKTKFGFYFYDMDMNIPKKLIQKIESKKVVTEKERNIFYKDTLETIKKLKMKYNKLVITQAFLKNKHRKMFKKYFLDSKFIWIKCTEINRQKRLANRLHFISQEYDKKLQVEWEEPLEKYMIINNNYGKRVIVAQLKNYYEKK